MVMSRDTDRLFWKFVIMTRFLIKFQENVPNLVLHAICFENKSYDLLKICLAESAPLPHLE